MGNYVSLSFNITLAVFIFLGLFWGFVRGWKKSLSRNIFLLVTSLLLILLVVPITNALINIPIETTVSFNGEVLDTGKTNLAGIIEVYIKAFLGEELTTSHPELAKTLVGIPVIFINAILYLILFWLLKLILLPVNALINKIFDRRPKENLGFAAGANDGDQTPIEEEVSGAFITKSERISEEKKPEPNELIYEEAPKQKKEKEPLTVDEATKRQDSVNQKIKELQIKQRPPKPKKPKKSFKNRLLGSLIGVATGLIITFNTMLPVYGFMDILKQANELKIDHLSDKEISLNTLTSGGSQALLDSYNSSIMGFLSTYTGMQAVGLKSFDIITTQNLNGKKVVLREELGAIMSSVDNIDSFIGKYKTYTDEGLENLTQAQLDDLLSQAHSIVASCKDVKIVNILADYALPAICSFLITSEIKISEDELVNTLFTELLTEVIAASGISITEELDNILDIADYVNEQKLLLPLIKQDLSDPITLVKAPEEDFAKNIIDKVLNLQVVNVALPNVFTLGIEYFDSIYKLNIENNKPDKETIIKGITDIVDNAFQAGRTFDKESPIYLTLNSLEPIGRMLDSAKGSGIINANTYSKLVDWGVSKIRTLTNSLIPEELIDVVNNEILSNMTKVNSWETEMTQIKSAIDILRDNEDGILGEVKEGEDLRTGTTIKLSIKENKINNIGLCLDALEKTTLFGTTTSAQASDTLEYHPATPITKLVASLCDYASNTLKEDLEEDDSMLEIIDILSDAKNNLIRSSHKSFAHSKFFENEFKTISPLIVEMYNTITSEDFEITSNLGTTLDKAKTSIMFGGDTTTKLVATALDIIQDEVLGSDYVEDTANPTINDKIYNLITATITHLESEDIVTTMQETPNFWEVEIDILKELQSLSEDIKTLDSIDNATSISATLDKVFTSIVIPKTEMKNIISFAVRDIKTDATTGVDGQINTILETIATNIENETFEDSSKDYTNYWQIEFGHLQALNNIKFNDTADDPLTPENEEYKVLDNLNLIGFELDKVTLGYSVLEDDSIKLGKTADSKSYTRHSYLIEHNTIRDLTAAGIDEMTTTITNGFTDPTINTAISTALTSISSNVKDTTNIPLISFTSEMTHLSSLASLQDISIDSSIFTSADESDLERLNTLGGTLDSIAFNVTNSASTYSYNESVNSKIITRTIINTLISDITPMAKGSNDIINTTVDTLYTRIRELGATTLLSWEKELNKVHDLVALNSTNISSIDTTEDQNKLRVLGINIDAIAFNSDIVITEGVVTTNPTKYFDGYEYYATSKYNSIIITRSILKTTIASFINQAKTESPSDLTDEIVNDLINNTSAYVNTTNNVNASNTYLNFSQSFEDLIATKADIEALQEEFETVDLETLEEEKAKSVDEFLSTEQSRLICGVLTTRKVMIVILTNLQSSMNNITTVFNTTDPGKYLSGLISHYNANNSANSTTPEQYSYGSTYNMTTDGNALSADYSNIDTTNPIETLRVSWLNYLDSLI